MTNVAAPDHPMWSIFRRGLGPMKLVHIDEILVGGNVRRELDDIEELAASIVAVHEMSGGHKYLLQHVYVKRTTEGGKKYELRYGFRRVAALRYLWEKNSDKYIWASKVPIIIDEDTYDEGPGANEAFKLVENIQRTPMNILDEALAIKHLMDVASVNQTKVAGLLGKTKGWVSQRLALLTTDATVQSAVQDGTIGQAAARELSKASKEVQRQTMKKIVEEDNDTTPSVETVKDVVTKFQEDASRGPTPEMSHEEKLRMVRERAEQQRRAEGKPTVEPSAERFHKSMERALLVHDKVKAAFYAGAEQALLYSAGERKSIRFPKALFGDDTPENSEEED